VYWKAHLGCQYIPKSTPFQYFCLLGITYRTPSHEILKVSNTFSAQTLTSFNVFLVVFRNVSGSVSSKVCSVLCFSSSILRGLFEWSLLLRNPHKQKSGLLWSLGLGVQKSHPELRSPKLLYHSSCVPNVGRRSIKLKPAVFFIFFQQRNESGSEGSDIIPRCLLKIQWSHNSPLRHCVSHDSLQWMQRICKLYGKWMYKILLGYRPRQCWVKKQHFGYIITVDSDIDILERVV
jgi:hypothetical protein